LVLYCRLAVATCLLPANNPLAALVPKNEFMKLRIIAFVLAIGSGLLATGAIRAQEKSAETPSSTVRKFYDLLRHKKYIEGFSLSVYRAGLDGLKEEELQDLAPEFERMAAALPELVQIEGEQISGERASVFIKLPNEQKAQEVMLIKQSGEWIVGDSDTQKFVKKQGRNFFFNERMRVSEAEANEWLQEILGYELIYFKAKQRYATFADLSKAGSVSEQLLSGTVSGYVFEIQISANAQKFSATARPVAYGRTGRLSFYSDQTNLVRAEDKSGKAASISSPPYQVNNN
jgi:hypothetical protein